MEGILGIPEEILGIPVLLTRKSQESLGKSHNSSSARGTEGIPEIPEEIPGILEEILGIPALPKRKSQESQRKSWEFLFCQ